MSQSFNSFCKRMYKQNCQERQGYKDVILSYEEYYRNNEQFLLDIYEEVCNNCNTD